MNEHDNDTAALWFFLLDVITTACAVIGEALVPGTLNHVNYGLLAALYALTIYVVFCGRLRRNQTKPHRKEL